MKVYLQELQHTVSAEQMYCLYKHACVWVCTYVHARSCIMKLPVRARWFGYLRSHRVLPGISKPEAPRYVAAFFLSTRQILEKEIAERRSVWGLGRGLKKQIFLKKGEERGVEESYHKNRPPFFIQRQMHKQIGF